MRLRVAGYKQFLSFTLLIHKKSINFCVSLCEKVLEALREAKHLFKVIHLVIGREVFQT